MLKAALYARVSSEEQVKRENSIPAQLRALRDYCQKNSIEIYNEYTDEAITGQIGDRPAFQQMLSDAYSGMVDIILVHKFDRFARKVELSRQIKSNLKSANVNVVSITEPIEDSPMGFFMEGLYELMAEYYVKNLSQEVQKGMNERARKGKHMGQMPYGFYCKNGEVFVNEDQSSIVQKIYQMYDNGYGHLKIARWLNDNRIPTYSGIIGGWQSFQVKQILKNCKYIGLNLWNGSIYDADFPAIIDEELFKRVQDKQSLASKNHTYHGDNYAKHHLLGLLYCGECGSLFRIKSNEDWQRKKTDKYLCRDASLYRNSCQFTKLFDAEMMENDIDAYLKEILSGVPAHLNIKTAPVYDHTETLKKQLDKINMELSRAKQAYISGVFELDEYRELRSELELQKKDIESSFSRVPTPLSDAEKRCILTKKIKSVWDLYETVQTAEEKRTILQTFIKQICIYRDRWEVIFYI